ncbi:hypothetical protein BDY17DRAFT_313924 [Neohortaea acidophila]|uniref:SWIRM domain-containing protein n=1 Tax=Neohortaea acidophila TaxID=245834 RepID=A0A6A6PH90_9PEZI|nr:uncharacterized protein BDY17DRAFT_313924 [Neohortaea acidophila]KAF2478637.1 hypothetical protein BDY17DRAFT_313924 [Neohortaea acidophila]
MAAQHTKHITALQSAGYLFTPPENTVDSFSHQELDDEELQKEVFEGWRTAVRQPAQLSPIVHTPPASPKTTTLPSITSAIGFTVSDSPLYPEQTPRARIDSQQPLFATEPSLSPSPKQAIVKPVASPTLATPAPVRQTLHYPHNLGVTTKEQAWQYYQDRMAELQKMRGPRLLPQPEKSPRWNLHKEDRRQLESLTRPAGVSKPRPAAARVPAKVKAPLAPSTLVKAAPSKRRTPKARTMHEFVDSAFPQRESTTKHKRAPPTKKVEGENVNWTDLPDYAPPVADLDTMPRSLKVTWHGHPLTPTDADVVHLHEQEVAVASTLRLSAAIYLTNKRKIFQARLQSLKDNKNFTKTAAQSACKIDVNKASQLWEAFDRVGWFNPEWFKQWL